MLQATVVPNWEIVIFLASLEIMIYFTSLIWNKATVGILHQLIWLSDFVPSRFPIQEILFTQNCTYWCLLITYFGMWNHWNHLDMSTMVLAADNTSLRVDRSAIYMDLCRCSPFWYCSHKVSPSSSRSKMETFLYLHSSIHILWLLLDNWHWCIWC